jgi:2'-5' RNA ligase
MDPFAAETYLCLDLPTPVAEHVLRIRRAYHDHFRAALPAEITVAGSSGLGVVCPGQDPAAVFAALDHVASATPPIVARFGSVRRFPNTDIFVFTLVDETPFRLLQQRLATSGIRFGPSPFPFTPHCTLRSRPPVTVAEASALLELRITKSFVLEVLTAYALTGIPMTRLHTTRLAGRT